MDEFLLLADLNNLIHKLKVYLLPGEKPPKGVPVKIGPRRGRFYETTEGTTATITSPTVSRPSRQITPIQRRKRRGTSRRSTTGVPTKTLAQKWYGGEKEGILREQKYKTVNERKTAVMNRVPPMYRDSAEVNEDALTHPNSQIFNEPDLKWLARWKSKDKKTGESVINYLYNYASIDNRNKKKWDQMQIISEHLDEIRGIVRNLLHHKDIHMKAVGGVIELLDKTAFRVGSEEYAETHETYGMSSLLREHVKVLANNKIELNFVGKRGVEQKKKVQVSPELHDFISIMKKGRQGEKLFPVTESMIGGALREFGVRPKDFRTYHANRILVQNLSTGPKYVTDRKAREKHVKETIKSVAEELGHTWTVSRQSYLDPAIVLAYLDGKPITEFSQIYKMFTKQELKPMKEGEKTPVQQETMEPTATAEEPKTQQPKTPLPEERIYVIPGEKPPEGAQIIEGPKGGKFYIPQAKEENGTEEDKDIRNFLQDTDSLHRFITETVPELKAQSKKSDPEVHKSIIRFESKLLDLLYKRLQEANPGLLSLKFIENGIEKKLISNLRMSLVYITNARDRIPDDQTNKKRVLDKAAMNHQIDKISSILNPLVIEQKKKKEMEQKEKLEELEPKRKEVQFTLSEKEVLDLENAITEEVEDLYDNQIRSDIKREVNKKISEEIVRQIPAQDLHNFLYDVLTITPSSDPEEMADKVTDTLISFWANTSGDSEPISLALQIVAKQEFDLKDVMTEHWEDVPMREGNEFVKSHSKIFSTFIKAQYDQTQKWLKDHNIEYVTVYRGMALDRDKATPGLYKERGTITNIKLQPVSSFTTGFYEAHGFTGGYKPETDPEIPLIMAIRVPASKVFSTCRTGVGCLTEKEVTILGGEHKAFVMIAQRSPAEDIFWNNAEEIGVTTR